MSDRVDSKKTLRILVVTHSPLSKEFGAGQMAINLAEAFKVRGNDVILWSPYPMPNLTRWWQSLQSFQLMRSKLDEFLKDQNHFNVIDCPSFLITKKVAQSTSLVIARSVQPDILYIMSNLFDSNNNFLKGMLLFPFNCFLGLSTIFLILQGWSRANYILCLGSLEKEWMYKWFPWWKSKLFVYVNALSKEDQFELKKIRLSRKKQQYQEGTKFIWIGRWVPHKGIKKLVEFILQRADSNPHDTFTIAGCKIDAERAFPFELFKSGRLNIIPSFARHEIFLLLADHDVGLFTSNVEGWGLVLNEMLESGMIVFATAAGGTNDLQPFFETLMLFPIPQVIPDFSPSSNQSIEQYHEIFNWDKITEIYTNIIL